MIAGTTTTFGTGAWKFALPNSAYSKTSVVLPIICYDSGGLFYQGSAICDIVTPDLTTILPLVDGPTGSASVTDAMPFTWGAGDTLMISGMYESA